MLKAANTVLLALLAIACCDSEILSQEPPQTPQVEPQQQPERSIKGQQEPTTQPNAAGAAPFTIPNSHSSATNNEPQSNAQYGGEEGTEFWPLFGHRLKITDTLLVVVTFLLFGATIALWWSTRRLVRGTEKTAKDQLRAHIGTASSLNNFPSLNIGQKQLGSVLLTGYGQTPARKLRYWGAIVSKEYPLATVLPILPFRRDCRPINPRQTFPIIFETSNPLTAAEEQDIRAGKRRFYLYGAIEYFDIFGERRETTFRYRYGDPRSIASKVWVTCEEGNDQT